MSYLYEIKEISKVYGHGGGATQALKSVNLTIEEGKLTAILGPSGSGKSTLLNILGALDKPSSGQVLFLGEDISHYSNKKLAKFRRENIGFVFQNHNLIDSLSIFDNIATPIMLTKTNPKEIIKRVQELAKTLNITHLLNRKPDECSGGEKQRCLIHRWNDHNILWSKK